MDWQADLNLIQQHLQQAIPTDGWVSDECINAMNYSLLSGGKRVRAVLVLSVCRALGGSNDAAIPLACAVEMVHAYSLIHDDLPCMDNDDMRRGKPSCHKAYGEATALLAGDALLTEAFATIATANTLSSEQKVAAVAELATAAGCHGMVAGQAMDMYFDSHPANREQLFLTHRLKTGKLICAAVKLGAIASGQKHVVWDKLEEYAYKLGLAFQIVDDILDVVSTSEKLGKPVLSDEKNHKSTSVSLLGLQGAKEYANKLTAEAEEAIKAAVDDSDFLVWFTKELLERTK